MQSNTPHPDSPEDILQEFGAKLLGYDSMNELYHQDSGDLEDYHEMKRILNNINHKLPATLTKLEEYYTNKFLEGKLEELEPIHALCQKPKNFYQMPLHEQLNWTNFTLGTIGERMDERIAELRTAIKQLSKRGKK